MWDQLVDAVLPAGGRISGDFANAAGADIKALITLGGVSILERTITSLARLQGIGRIVVVGPEETLKAAAAARAHAALTELGTGSANIIKGIEWLQSQPDAARRVLVATTDMPFLSTDVAAAFLRLCPHDRDICVPVVERTPFELKYPGLIRTDSRLADGWFRLGGLFLLDPSTLITNRQRLDQVFAARKSNLQLARLIGFRTAARYLTRRLGCDQIAERAAEILNCTGAVIKDAPPEIAFDLDLVEEYNYAAKLITTANWVRQEARD